LASICPVLFWPVFVLSYFRFAVFDYPVGIFKRFIYFSLLTLTENVIQQEYALKQLCPVHRFVITNVVFEVIVKRNVDLAVIFGYFLRTTHIVYLP